MQERTTKLSVEIQARLNKLIGIDEVKQELDQFSKEVQKPFDVQSDFDSIRSRQEYQQRAQEISPLRIGGLKGYGEIFKQDVAKFEIESLNTYNKILKDAELYEGQTIPKSVRGKWGRWLGRMGQQIDDLGMDYAPLRQSARSDSEREIIDAEERTQNIVKQRIASKVKEREDALEKFIAQINKTTDATGGLFEALKGLGILVVGGQAVKFGADYLMTEAQISARYRTAFDLTSPVSQFSQYANASLYERTQERSLAGRGLGSLIGGVAGGVIGGIAGWGMPWAIGGGMALGSQAGGLIAGLANVKDTAETQEYLKFLQQTYGVGEQFVNTNRPYEITQTIGGVRYGAGFGERQVSGIGISPLEELQYQMQYAQSARNYNPDTFREQTLFARRYRLDPNQIYGINALTRMTGENIGEDELNAGAGLAQRIYGNQSTERIVDVLTAIKEINVRMLQYNEKADFDRAKGFAELPALIMGKDSYYGRMEGAQQTLGYLGALGQGNTPLQQVMLYQAYGETDPLEYLRKKQRGFWDSENAKDILTYFNNLSEVDPYGAELYLTDVIGQPDISEQFFKKAKEPSSFKKLIQALEGGGDTKSILEDNGIVINRYEKTQEDIQTKMIKRGRDLADTFLKISKDMVTFQSKLLGYSETQQAIIDSTGKAIELLNDKILSWGLAGKNPFYDKIIGKKALKDFVSVGINEQLAKKLIEDSQADSPKDFIENLVASFSENKPDHAVTENFKNALDAALADAVKELKENRLKIDITLHSEDGREVSNSTITSDWNRQGTLMP